MKRIAHWIDGKVWEGVPERTGPVFDPARGVVTGEVAMATVGEVDAAVEAAARAFEEWRHVPVTRRQSVMFEFRRIVAERRREMAELLTSEHGKTIPDALGEVQRGLEVVEFACNIAHLVKGEFSEQVSTGVDTYTIRQPLGVVAGITPFNFPAMVPMWMYPLAIAAGNTFVLKPSEKDPSVSLLAAEWLAEAGLPPGVFNVVHGDKVAVDDWSTQIAAVSSGVDAHCPLHLQNRTATSVSRRWAEPEPHGSAPDADMELRRRRGVGRVGSAGERCMAISVVVMWETPTGCCRR